MTTISFIGFMIVYICLFCGGYDVLQVVIASSLFSIFVELETKK